MDNLNTKKGQFQMENDHI